LAFLAFGLTASATYILNDLVDVEYDRRHPRKCLRPFSAGDISLLSGWLIWPIILFLAFTISIATLPKLFLVALSAYLALNFAYSFFLKKKAIIDVITLASLYTIRIIAGILALGVPLSFWLLSFSMFFFLSLALLKRFTEIKYVDFSDPSLKLAGRGYYPDDLSSVSSMGIASGYISVLVLALYVQDANVSHRFHQPEFIWLACPLLFFWISRIWLLVHRGRLDDDPVFFAAKDGVSWLILAGFVVLFLCAKLV
jgi:4-hydroxybenzoate polyprenyltransferase